MILKKGQYHNLSTNKNLNKDQTTIKEPAKKLLSKEFSIHPLMKANINSLDERAWNTY